MSPQYIAGLIDGEGYLGLVPHNHHPQITNAGFTPVIKMCLTGSMGKTIAEELKSVYGGTCDTRKKMTKGGRIAHTYHLRSKKSVIGLLEDIMPFLRVKLPQAILLKEFCLLPYEHPKSPKFNPKVIERRVELYKSLKELKRPELPATTK